jgi:hypothetical protein
LSDPKEWNPSDYLGWGHATCLIYRRLPEFWEDRTSLQRTVGIPQPSYMKSSSVLSSLCIWKDTCILYYLMDYFYVNEKIYDFSKDELFMPYQDILPTLKIL